MLYPLGSGPRRIYGATLQRLVLHFQTSNFSLSNVILIKGGSPEETHTPNQNSTIDHAWLNKSNKLVSVNGNNLEAAPKGGMSDVWSGKLLSCIEKASLALSWKMPGLHLYRTPRASLINICTPVVVQCLTWGSTNMCGSNLQRSRTGSSSNKFSTTPLHYWFSLLAAGSQSILKYPYFWFQMYLFRIDSHIKVYALMWHQQVLFKQLIPTPSTSRRPHELMCTRFQWDEAASRSGDSPQERE